MRQSIINLLQWLFGGNASSKYIIQVDKLTERQQANLNRKLLKECENERKTLARFKFPKPR